MTLYEECIYALGEEIEILSSVEANNILISFKNTFPITKWGRVDWNKFNSFNKITSPDNILEVIEKYDIDLNDSVYIIWDEVTLPIVKANLKRVLEVIVDITAVSFNTWLFNPSSNYIIEFYHENEITFGKLVQK